MSADPAAIDLAALCAAHGLTPDEADELVRDLFGPGGAWESIVRTEGDGIYYLQALPATELLWLLAEWSPPAGREDNRK
jgi:hypothetical protein